MPGWGANPSPVGVLWSKAPKTLKIADSVGIIGVLRSPPEVFRAELGGGTPPQGGKHNVIFFMFITKKSAFSPDQPFAHSFQFRNNTPEMVVCTCEVLGEVEPRCTADSLFQREAELEHAAISFFCSAYSRLLIGTTLSLSRC